MSMTDRRCRENIRVKSRMVVLLISVLSVALPTWVMAGPHDGLTAYQGSKTCMPCHPGKAEEVHASAHYQLKGQTPAVPNLGFAGKFGSINDFCTYPNINWLFQMVNLTGQKVVVGCATCHVGLGVKPIPAQTAAQLENIDCLMCHSDLYKRIGTRVAGGFRYVPDPTVDIPTVLRNIQMPSRAACLTRCHSGAGGGAGLKQGDIDPAQLNPPRSLDVHMSSLGAGLHCLDCHTARNHRIAGRGNDIRETDLQVKVDCTNCHGSAPHGSADLNHHTRVHCTVCHIPTFAKAYPTDVLRDFRIAVPDPVANRYEPVRTVRSNVTPTYRFFNGLSYFYKFGDPLVLSPTGSFVMARPLGNIRDPNAKLHAFKLHRAKMAYDLASLRLIPVKSKVSWETGNMDQAIRAGAAAVGWNVTDYGFATSLRYMSLHHQVAPKEQALLCGSCHGVGATQINFAALGYTPVTTRNGVPLCASCHSPEVADFYEIHREHVQNRGFSCSICHNF